MNKSFIRIMSRPMLENPILIMGLPGFGNIGRIVARLLIEFSQARTFAELYSPSFPDYVIIDKKGVCRPPRYKFYTSKIVRDLIILTGDTYPSLDDTPAHYEVCSEILDFISELGCKFIVTVGGAPTSSPAREIYVAATSKKIAMEYVEKGAIIYKDDRIIGASGLLLGLARNRGLDGVCLLGSTLGLTSDQESAFNVFKFLKKVLGTDVEEGP